MLRLVLVFPLLVATPAFAEHIKGKPFGCQDHDYLNRIYTAAIAKDEEAFKSLVAMGVATGKCIPLGRGPKGSRGRV